MFWQILGMILSGIVSLIIAHLYYKKASTDLRIETANLKKLNEELNTLINDLGELDEKINEDTETIKQVVIRGTNFDPKYPYK